MAECAKRPRHVIYAYCQVGGTILALLLAGAMLNSPVHLKLMGSTSLGAYIIHYYMYPMTYTGSPLGWAGSFFNMDANTGLTYNSLLIWAGDHGGGLLQLFVIFAIPLLFIQLTLGPIFYKLMMAPFIFAQKNHKVVLEAINSRGATLMRSSGKWSAPSPAASPSLQPIVQQSSPRTTVISGSPPMGHRVGGGSGTTTVTEYAIGGEDSTFLSVKPAHTG